MIRIAACAVALFGLGGVARADPNGQDSPPKTSQDSSTSTPELHTPSSGLTLETLKALPPTSNSWYPPLQTRTYQPYSFGGYYPSPYYTVGHPYPSYAVPRYGMGGYYPARTGGNYPAAVGWWFFW